MFSAFSSVFNTSQWLSVSLLSCARSVQPNLNQWDEGHEDDEDDIDVDEAFHTVSRGFTRSHEPETCTGFRWISGKRPIAAIALRICHGFQDSDPHWHYDRDEDSSASLTLCFMQINHCIIQSLYHCINHCQCHWDCFFCSFRMISSTMHRALPRLASKRRSMLTV